MLERERQRGKKEMEKERKKIEAAFAAEKEAAGQKAALLQGKLEKSAISLMKPHAPPTRQ